MLKYFTVLIVTLLIGNLTITAADKTPPPLQGEIKADGEPVAFATVQLKSTTVGSASDLNGKFFFEEIPEGEHTLIIKSIGHKTKEVTINFTEAKPLDINISLEADVLGLDQVVVTADKHPKRRIDASMVVNTMTPKAFSQTQSVTLSEGLNFTPGLRTENTCQNCGANSVRMNGMDGSYSQVLINGRQIFSGLASVYGLEILPANMIEQVEVVKGGGSALYGSNAIAGTINLITKEPSANTFNAEINNGIIGIGNNKTANDLNLNFHTSVVSEDKNSGMSLYGTHRKREGYFDNDDEFTELAQLNNVTLGTSIYHRMGYRNKITFDYFHIEEARRGGDDLDTPEHETQIAESIRHNINTGAVNFTRFVGENNGELSIYASAQHVDRWTYYGAEMDPSGYGSTTDLAYAYGTQYKADYGKSNFIVGVENNGSILKDKKKAYTDDKGERIDERLVSDQTSNIVGVFGQYEYAFPKLTISAGLRGDYYDIQNKVNSSNDLSNLVVSPRLNLLYSPSENIRIRGSYSQGYKAPQIFDEDLHIETSAARQVFHINGDNLKQETSHSFMASFNYHTDIGNGELEFLMEGFHTYLDNPFVHRIEQDENDETLFYHIRFNSGVAGTVQGINFELRYAPSVKMNFNSGFTTQKSFFEDKQEYAGNVITDEFLRTPNNYGFFTLNYLPIKNFTLSTNATYTGKMKIEYFGNSIAGELRTTDQFFDMGLKGEYIIRSKGFDVGLSCGVKNIFNSYQSDFDNGIDRDPGYIYGPQMPRTIYFGVKIGNLL
ncbi:TonB-dependent receptor [Labilibacter marinus]|uniref:TonB-dependent receptor n=1 Tax=Labilibacter marinus TaxID=1477105 RepID=UPI000950015E|nr:TonB-dependent receptor [Labilibacter marinus]